MNERIRELAKQAGIKITPMIIDGIEYEYEDVDMDGSEDLAKFAELIVRECITVSEAHAKSLEAQPSDPILEEYEDGIVNGIYEATAAIKEHFEVKQ